MYKVLLLIASFITSFASIAQTGRLTGKITDSKNEPVAYATIGAYHISDSSLIGFSVCDKAGMYVLKGLPVEKPIQIVVSATGYKTIAKRMLLKGSDTLNIQLNISGKEMDTVVVSFAPPVRVKKDTIEFNTAAFAGLPNEAIGELLKRLPGLQQDEKGQFTINGKPVSKITIEGNDFFSGNQGMLLKNIPAAMIEKVQVADDKTVSKTKKKNNEQPQQINLKLKKSAAGKPFGKLYAGAGSNSRYEGGAMLNTISAQQQIGLIGMTNNLNRTGFSVSDANGMEGEELVESMNYSRRQTNGYQPDNSGLNTTWGGGINYGGKYKNDKYSLGNIATGVNRKAENETFSQTFLGDTVMSNRNSGISNTRSFSNRAAGQYTWVPDTVHSLYVQPSWNYSQNRGTSAETGSTSSNISGRQNEYSNNSQSVSNTNRFTLDLAYDMNSRNKKNSIQAYMYASGSDISMHEKEDRFIQYYKENQKAGKDSISQQMKNQLNEINIGSDITMKHKLNKYHSLGLSLNGEFRQDNKDKDVNAYNEAAGKHLPDQGLSYQSRYRQYELIPALVYGYTKNKFDVNLGLGYSYAASTGSLHQGTDTRFSNSFQNFVPRVDLNYKDIRFYFYTRVMQPSVESRMPFTDSTNRLNVRTGNSALKPAIDRVFNLMYSKYFTRKNFSVYASGSFRFTNDQTTENTTVNSKGITYLDYLNTNRNHNIFTSFHISKTYKLTNGNLILGLIGRYNRDRSAIYTNSREILAYKSSYTVAFRNNINIRDLITNSLDYEFSFNESKYSSGEYTNYNYLKHEIKLNQTVRVLKKVSLENNMIISFTPGLPGNFRKSVVLWNAGASVHFLKEEKAQLRLSIFDLLQQNIFQDQTIELNKFTQSRNNSLSRHGLLTFIYYLRPASSNTPKAALPD